MKMTFEKLIGLLDFSPDDRETLLNINDGLSRDERADFIKALSDKETFQDAEKRLIDRLLPDESGLKILKVMLICAAEASYKKYVEKGISDEVFIATMKCFSRFCGEHKTQKGYFGFDRSFWTGRQLSLMIFRLGELEYEFTKNQNGEKEICIHIPSSCDLSKEKIDESIELSKKFVEKYMPDYIGKEYVTLSWLLSPQLKEVLPSDSKILAFAARFEVTFLEQSNDYKFWVYGSHDIAPEDFPETTTLRRNLKRYILAGNVFTCAGGKLKN